jgi:ribonucleoside-diphosphate reductase alpha chain
MENRAPTDVDQGLPALASISLTPSAPPAEPTLKLTENAKKVVGRRYLKKDLNGQPNESPEDMFWRVACNIAEADAHFDSNADVAATARRFYELMVSLSFLPNSPTLMNAGRDLQQLSACFVLPINDSMEDIFETLKHTALIHKSGGGCIAGDARVWTTFCGIEPIEVLFNRAILDGRTGVQQGRGIAYDVSDLNIRTASMNPQTGETGLRPVTHVWKFDVPADQQYTITTRGGTLIQTSAWHPFMVLREGALQEVEAADLTAGDIVLGPERPDNYWPWQDYKRIGELTINAAIGWLIGFTLGDGSFGYVPALRQYRLRWFSGTDDVLIRAQEILAAEQNIKISIQKDKRGLLSLSTLTQRFVHDMLEACGLEQFSSKDTHIRIPECIAKSPLPVVRAFLAGLLDSDGYVAEDGSPSYSTVSREMSDDLAALLSLLGYQPSIVCKPPHGKGHHDTYTIQFCPLPHVNRLAAELSPYLANTLRKSRLHSDARKQTALSLPFRFWREVLRQHGLVYERSDKSKGSDPLADEMNRWSCNVAGRCRRDDLLKVAACLAPYDKKNADLLYRVALYGQEIASVENAADPKPFYDLTVADWNTYAAGQAGMTMVHNTGFAFSRLRPKNDRVRSTHGVSSGPVSFMKIFDSATEHVKQGGTRRGANMGILRVDHPDILEFIECKAVGNTIQNFNISVAITESFMQAVARGDNYDLINPRNGKISGSLNAKEIFDKLTQMAWQSGDPGIVFIDRINRDNPTPHVGEMESTNPCGEQPLLPYESCNLGSINLTKVLNGKRIDWPRLAEIVHDAVHFLDNVIEMNHYPLPQIDAMTKANRKIGLGVMGFADMLIQLGIPYNSDKAVETAESLMKFIQDESKKASAKLAQTRGAFPNFPGSIYDQPGAPKLRNATTTTIAPTGTISMIAGASSGVEPLFALAYVKNVMDNTALVEVNPMFEESAKLHGFYYDELMQKIAEHGSVKAVDGVPEEYQRLFVTSHDIKPEWHTRIQAAFQKYCDNAVSKTVNFANHATVEDVREVYTLAYQLGCKGVTIYRDGSKDMQVLYAGTSGPKQEVVVPEPAFHVNIKPRPRPEITSGSTFKIGTGCGNLYITINEDEHGPCEVFSQMGKTGGCASAQSEAVSRLASLALRAGVEPHEVMEQLTGIRCPLPSWQKNGMVLSCPDGMSKVLKKYLHDSGNGEADKPISRNSRGDIVGMCPDCGHVLEFVEGCAVCKSCGFSKCG